MQLKAQTHFILHHESIDSLVQSRLGFLLPLEDGVRDGTFSSTRLVGGHEEFREDHSYVIRTHTMVQSSRVEIT